MLKIVSVFDAEPLILLWKIIPFLLNATTKLLPVESVARIAKYPVESCAYISYFTTSELPAIGNRLLSWDMESCSCLADFDPCVPRAARFTPPVDGAMLRHGKLTAVVRVCYERYDHAVRFGWRVSRCSREDIDDHRARRRRDKKLVHALQHRNERAALGYGMLIEHDEPVPAVHGFVERERQRGPGQTDRQGVVVGDAYLAHHFCHVL